MEKPAGRKKKTQAPKEESVQKAAVKGEKAPRGKKPSKRGRSPTSVVNVAGSLNTKQTTFATRESTLERSPSSVTSAGRPSDTAQMSPNI